VTAVRQTELRHFVKSERVYGGSSIEYSCECGDLLVASPGAQKLAMVADVWTAFDRHMKAVLASSCERIALALEERNRQWVNGPQGFQSPRTTREGAQGGN